MFEPDGTGLTYVDDFDFHLLDVVELRHDLKICRDEFCPEKYPLASLSGP